MSALVVIALTVLVSAGLFSFRGRVLQSQTSAPLSPNPDFVSSPSLIPDPSSTPYLTSTPRPFPSNLPSPTPMSSSETTDWVYPNSIKTGDTTYTSSDSTEAITAWYQTKIDALGYSVKSFVKTKANDKVLNKLAAARASSEISVEIFKEPAKNAVLITLHIDNQ